MGDEDFFIPTGEELDRGAAPGKLGKRSPLQWLRGHRRAPRVEREPRRVELEVPESIGAQKKVRSRDRALGGDTFIDTGSRGRIVRSIDASDLAAKRDLIIPAALREKYGLDD